MFSIFVLFIFLGINLAMIPVVYKLFKANIKAWVDFSNTLIKYILKKRKTSKTNLIGETK